MAKGSGRVRFNVGGEIFETTTTTIANAGRDSMLAALLDDDWNLAAGDGAVTDHFIDRNPAYFSVLLDLLRSGELHRPPHLSDKLLCREALFYGLLDHVRAARWGTFDGDRLRRSASVYGRAPGDATAVRAAPDGGCCVAHGSVVHVYDWMLEEHTPINLDYQQVNDAGYVDSSHIVVAAQEGGMGLFSSSSGELCHRFRVLHDDKAKSFSARALCFSDSQFKIFASCKGDRLNEYGIGVWDQRTGNQSDFFYEPLGCPLGDADKLQWIKGESFLMALFPKTDGCFIGLLDFRVKDLLVWSWADEGTMRDTCLAEKKILDATVMEDNRSICIVNQYEDLGFLELRSNGGGVRWSSRSSKPMIRRRRKGIEEEEEECCYPKLVMNGDQLFCSTNNGISVFCRPEWVHNSTLQRSVGGSICDFSIGGDRLFALHNDEDVFYVWETPTLPIM